MKIQKKIDCHTHIINDAIAKEYFSKTSNFAIVMQFLDKFKINGIEDNSYHIVKENENLFLCPCVDILGDIPSQLDKIETQIQKVRVVGLKIYLTYQIGRADDEKMFCIYEFAEKHNLSVTFHTGSCSLVLPSDGDLAGSDAKYVKNAAEKFPNVNFILAHMDDPRYNECIREMQGVDNMFTDFSGAYEPGTKEGGDIEGAIKMFGDAIHQFPDTYKKILYGTDFCPPINLSAIEEYDYTISKLFEEEQFEDIYYNNCLRAFPKIKEYIERRK